MRIRNRFIAGLVAMVVLAVLLSRVVVPAAGGALLGKAAVTGVSGPGRATAGPPNFLHTEGSKIVDSHGNEVRLTGVNWFGMETGTFAPHGLWERN